MSYEFKQSSITSGTFSSVCCDSSGRYLGACEEGGNVYTSFDYGANWVLRTLNSNGNYWQSICTNSTGARLYVTGNANLSGQYTQIWQSVDYGGSWSKSAGGGDNNFNFTSICCNSSGGIAAACVSGGFILVSTNSGSTFNQRATSLSWKSVCINGVGDRLAAVANNNYIWTSSNYGTNWAQKTTITQTWSSICSNSLGDRLAATVQNGNIWISTNYGDTWLEKVIETGNLVWTSICSNGTGQILAACHNTIRVGFTGYSIYISSDYGDTWTQKVLPSASYIALRSICLSKPGDNISASMFNGNGIIYGYSTSTFLYKNLPLYYCLAEPNASDTYNITITNYNDAFGTTLKYLNKFYLGVTNEATFDNDPKMYATVGYNSGGNINKFCPFYDFFAGTAYLNNDFNGGSFITTYSAVPPTGVTNMLAILVGGGGGGGGGEANVFSVAEAGDGGGSGGISVYYLPASAFTVSVGYGGKYGYARANSANGPGDIGTSNGLGESGLNGYLTRITVNNVNYDANGGYGGDGGGRSSGTGSDGAVATTTGLYNYGGNNGTGGGFSVNGNSLGGNGGVPKYSEILNTTMLNVISLQRSLVSTNISTTTLLRYGGGGNGGRGDADGISGGSANGEYGAPGCAFVFYYF